MRQTLSVTPPPYRGAHTESTCLGAQPQLYHSVRGHKEAIALTIHRRVVILNGLAGESR